MINYESVFRKTAYLFISKTVSEMNIMVNDRTKGLIKADDQILTLISPGKLVRMSIDQIKTYIGRNTIFSSAINNWKAKTKPEETK